MSSSAQTRDKESLVRGIRRWDLVAVAINGIIGAGIFGMPSEVYSRIGVYSLGAFVVCAIVVALIVLCFAEVGSRYTDTGGPYLYAREAFGRLAGFEVGWLMWLARLTAFAANCNLLIEYLSHFWPGIKSVLWSTTLSSDGAQIGAGWREIFIVVVVGALTLVNIVGVRNAAIVSNVFTIGKLIPIILFIGIGLFYIAPDRLALGTPPQYGEFSTSVLLLVYAFTGFEMAVIPAGEVRDPRRNLPMAILTALSIVVVIYILIQIVAIGTLPELASSKRPLADASGRFLGAAGAAIISGGAVVSIVGNLNVVLLAGSRLPFAMAERRELPAMLAAVHPRFRTPHAAILLTSAVMLLITLSGTFVYAATISAIARLLAYAGTCAALPALRRKATAPAAQFRVPAGTLVSAVSLLAAAWLVSNSTRQQARDSAIAAAIGLLVYLFFRIRRRAEYASTEYGSPAENTSISSDG